MSLPAALQAAIAQTLADYGDASPMSGVRPVSGGDINQAARVETGRAAYFVKWHRNAPPRMFEVEADGLRRLREADCIRVPEVVGWRAGEAAHPDFLILEWIDSGGAKSDRSTAARLGESLAALHRVTAPAYGLGVDNFIGSTPQPNTPAPSWLAFYRDHRLGYQRDLAARQNRLPPERARLLDKLMASLDRWLDDSQTRPALIHGDLWGGNFMSGPNGEPVLIDPAVYYADREAEIAMTRLFGGFPAAFYDAYHAAYPLEPGHDERRDLYNLYHLLNHLNLFGGGYGGSVDGILRRYAG